MAPNSMMSGLNKHFDTDASLGATESRAIGAFLTENASNRWSGNAAPFRITETEGLKRAHRGDEIPAGALKRASV
jgi:hypothetical protein